MVKKVFKFLCPVSSGVDVLDKKRPVGVVKHGTLRLTCFVTATIDLAYPVVNYLYS